MMYLKFLDSLYYFLNLIRFSHLTVFLKIDSWITLPRCFEDEVTPSDSGFAKMPFADGNQVIKRNILYFLTDFDGFLDLP